MTAKRTDLNHAEIRDALRAIGAFVADTHELGHGFPDLLVVRPDRAMFLVEVKSPGGELTADEKHFAAACPATVHVVRSAEEAIRIYTGTPGRL